MSMIGNFRRLPQTELDELLAQPDNLAAFLYGQAAPENYLDVDKTWHAVHYLLNGETWEGKFPLSAAVMGGENLGDEDMGYGPARYLTPDAVAAVDAALAEIPPDALLAGYEPGRLNDAEIYPQVWRDDEDDRQYIASNYRALLDFYRAAAAAGDAVIVWIS